MPVSHALDGPARARPGQQALYRIRRLGGCVQQEARVLRWEADEVCSLLRLLPARPRADVAAQALEPVGCLVYWVWKLTGSRSMCLIMWGMCT